MREGVLNAGDQSVVVSRTSIGVVIDKVRLRVERQAVGSGNHVEVGLYQEVARLATLITN